MKLNKYSLSAIVAALICWGYHNYQSYPKTFISKVHHYKYKLRDHEIFWGRVHDPRVGPKPVDHRWAKPQVSTSYELTQGTKNKDWHKRGEGNKYERQEQSSKPKSKR